MNILVLSCGFEQPYFNARLRSQCDYFTKQGHLVEVYTEPMDSIRFEHKYDIHELGEQDIGYLKWLFLSIVSVFTNYAENKFAYKVLWYCRRTKFDLVYCSTNSCFPLSAAAMIAKVKGIPLYVDMWDMEELDPSYVRYSWWNLIKALPQHFETRRRNDALAQAESITTVSPKHAEIIQTINPHVQVLYNGFNPAIYSYQPTCTDSFRINFFGYAFETQNVNMLLRIIERLGNELPKIQWSFYTNDLNYNHIKYASPNICGLLPPEVLPKAINQSSLVLLISDTENNGLNSEQFYQALGAERPMLYTNEAEGAIPDLLAFTHSGIATNSVNEAMNYIRDLYHQWEENGYTRAEVQNKELFNTHIQWQRLEQIFATCRK